MLDLVVFGPPLVKTRCRICGEPVGSYGGWVHLDYRGGVVSDWKIGHRAEQGDTR